MKSLCDRDIPCAIILAGGEGRRLRPFIQRLRGDALPKQYVKFIGTRSMLEHTQHRVEKLIPPERVFTVVSEDHMKHVDVCGQLLRRAKGTVIIQPENKDTGPGLFLPLLHVVKRHPDSVVAVFPSDHFVLEEDLFMGYAALACRVVEQDSDRMVLLGVEPDKPDSEYGYILAEEEANSAGSIGIQKVRRFIEKPGYQTAQDLVQKGGLWNTMVMIFKARRLLGLMRRLIPARYRPFQRIGKALGTVHEKTIVERTYRQLNPWNLSRELLELFPTRYSLRLSVLPLRGVFWSDWGSEARILSDLKRTGYQERLYENSKRSPLYSLGQWDTNRFSQPV
jgi:mannose-1-phosphate guanylyltransferase